MSPIYSSFGRIFSGASSALTPAEAAGRLRAKSASSNVLLARGNGSSYGDTCLNSDGHLIDMRSQARLIYFDESTGVLAAEAGMMLSQVIALATSRGYFPSVVPGTQLVTLGGAIANDIHGKNHHVAGTFGNHVEWLELLRSDGKVYRCSRSEHSDLFSATIGGMGLTGLILSAAVRLKAVASANVVETRQNFRNISEYLDLAEEADAQNEYAVAWIDQTAMGDRAGQGVLLAANHGEAPGGSSSAGSGLLGVPFQLPVTVLNKTFIRAFNAAYGWSKRKPADGGQTDWRSYFFPLDAVRNWNRLYGSNGLYQHQSVIPFEAARDALPRLLEASRQAGQASFLTVLKRFGAIRSPGLLSFARPGYTLTLDFPNRGEKTLNLLNELDAITVAAGGAVNPYKDARMSPKVFEASFPDWRKLEAMRDRAFQSDFWRRTAMRLTRT